MRLYESLSYENNNNNNIHHANDNIDRLSRNLHLNASSTVKTFTSNGNQQSANDVALVESSKTIASDPYFEISKSIGNDVLSSQQNWQLDTDFDRTQSSHNETYCFYGSHRKLMSRENLNINDDDNANGNDANSNELHPKECVDLIGDSSSDIEAEITRLINRSNLCRQNYEHESFKEVDPTTEDQFMDEEASLSLEKSPFPRGIINPNYPGFQHLAHTLSEHFVDAHTNQTGSMSDSDFSEVDSDFPSEGHSSENNNTFVCDDSNGNNIIEDSLKTNDNLSTVEEILRTVFESNSCHLTTAIEMLSEKEIQTDINTVDCMTDVNDCDLNTYLEHYDGGINIEHVEPFTKTKEIASPIIEPDVIRKSNSCECSIEQSIDKPDILLDISEDATITNGEKEEPGSAWSITPVDIVGNFELEVERELGLRGYKNRTFSSDSDEVDGPMTTSFQSNDKFLDKIADATLSGSKDTISMAHKLVSNDHKQLNDNEQIDKIHIPTAIVKPKYQKSTFDDRQLPTIAHMNDDETAWYEKMTNKCSASADSTHPKKIELPELDRKVKKHMKSNSVTNTNKPQCIQNSAYENKSLVDHRETAAHNNHIMKTFITESAIDSKETVCRAVKTRSTVPRTKTSVAVVQPRKKERMDERKLMETIVQMQIKKNAQLYRGQGFNNKPITATATAVSVKNSNANQSNINNSNTKYLNNNININNNNNGEHYTNSEFNQAKKDPKENSLSEIK